MIYSVILAAGTSSRMNGEKLLLPTGGGKMIEKTIMSAAGIADRMLVVIKKEIAGRFELPDGVDVVINDSPEDGQSSSLRLAAEWIENEHPECDGMMVFLADEPGINCKTASEVYAGLTAENISAPFAGGKLCHPVGFGRKFFNEIKDLTGDEGGRRIIMEHADEISRVPCASPAFDIDTREDYRKMMLDTEKLVIVRGAGDIATGTIYRLHEAGFIVIALETAAPTVIRRTVSFAQAIPSGRTEVEGVIAVRCEDIDEAAEAVGRGEIPVIVDPEGKMIAELEPAAVVDAILAKKNLGTSIDMAPAVIALGPGFSAGIDCDVVVETQRGHYLGRVIYDGPAAANTGVPGNIGGYTYERVVHAPVSGTIELRHDIGDHVEKGECIAMIGSTEVNASLTGVLRGMIAEGTKVPEGFKIADVDPRDHTEYCFVISDKARSVAGGALEAVTRLTGVIK